MSHKENDKITDNVIDAINDGMLPFVPTCLLSDHFGLMQKLLKGTEYKGLWFGYDDIHAIVVHDGKRYIVTAREI